jgi:hypothetical protein
VGVIAEQWSTYAAQVLPRDAPKVQRVETRRAFYAGALTLFRALIAGLDPDNDPTLEDVRRIDAIDAELKSFYKRVEAGRDDS